MKSFSSKLLLHNLLIISVCMLLLSIFNIIQNKKVLTEAKLTEGQNQIKLFASSIQSKIDELRNDVSFISSTPPIEGILRSSLNSGIDPMDSSTLKQWKNRLTTIFEEMLIAKEHYTQIRYIGIADKGREILRVERKGSRIFRTTDKNLQQKGDRDYFKEAIEVGDKNIYLSAFSLNQEFGKITRPFEMVVRAAVPIYQHMNRPFGIIIINMKYNRIFQDLKNQVDYSSEYFVIDSKQQILLHSNNNFNQIDLDGKAILLKDYLPSASKYFKTHKNTDTSSINQDDANFIMATQLRYNPLSTKQFLGIILLIKKQYLFAKVYKNLTSDLYFLLMLIFASLLVSFYYIKKLVAPIKLLKQMADDISRGKEIETIVPSVARNDEIAVLTNALLTMSKDIMEKNRLLKFQKDALDKTAIVVETDPNGVIKYVNDEFCKVSGYSHEELLNNTHRIINSGYHSKDFFKDLWDTINSGEIWHGEIRNKNKNGKLYWADTTIVPFKNENNKIEKFIAIRRDITKVKDHEQSLTELAAAKSRFLAIMSHEIRTPLNGILGMTTLLFDEKFSEEGKKHLNFIKSNGETLRNLINDILDYSKIEAGKIQLEYIPFNPFEMVNHVVSLFHPSASAKGLDLKIYTKKNLPEWISCDITRSKQVLTNLLSNAIKFTSEGNIEISIDYNEISENSFLFQIEVKDTGIGIPKNKQTHLFNSFEQVDSSTSRNFGGTGLGLAISKGIAVAMGGNIEVSSDYQKGSTFSFTFKAMKTEQKALTDGNYNQSDAANLDKEKPMTILVVDDNEVNLEISKKFLSKLGHHADIAHDGVEAINILKNKTYDVIFMDAQMPGLDGYQTTQKIRLEMKKQKQPWIIACTADASSEDREKSLSSGMDDFLAKPVSLQTFKAAIQKAKRHTS